MHNYQTLHAADLPSTLLRASPLRASSPKRTAGVGCLIVVVLVSLHIGLFWVFREASAKSKMPEDPKGATVTFELSIPQQSKVKIAGPESPKPQPLPPAPAAKPEPKPAAPKKTAHTAEPKPRVAEPKKKRVEKKPVEKLKSVAEASSTPPSAPTSSTATPAEPNQTSSTPAPASTVSDSTAVVPAQEGRFKVSNPKPKYSMQARRQRLSGVVVVKAAVSEEGQVTEARIKTSSGHSLLDDSALEAVRMWQLEPMRQGGRAVSSWKEISFNFHLS